MFLCRRNDGPLYPQIKPAEPTRMLTLFCLNVRLGTIKSTERCTESELALYWGMNYVWDHFSITSRASLQHTRTAGEIEDFCSLSRSLSRSVTSVWIKSSPVESVCECYTSHMSEPKLLAWTLPAIETTPQISASL